MTISETVPPSQEILRVLGAAYWERSQDPAHIDAFPAGIKGEFIDAPPIFRAPTTGERRSGWMAIFADENPAGFIADGDEEAGAQHESDYVQYVGPFGHVVAVPMTQHILERTVAQHMRMAEQRGEERGLKEYATRIWWRRLLCK